jgi:hypothetical protein
VHPRAECHHANCLLEGEAGHPRGRRVIHPAFWFHEKGPDSSGPFC